MTKEESKIEKIEQMIWREIVKCAKNIEDKTCIPRRREYNCDRRRIFLEALEIIKKVKEE